MAVRLPHRLSLLMFFLGSLRDPPLRRTLVSDVTYATDVPGTAPHNGPEEQKGNC